MARDEATGVGQILATTTLGRAPYLVGKFISNFAVLASMTGALAVTALAMQLWRGEDRSVDPIALITPFLLITLPVLAVTAAAAVLFETVPGLRGGVGNLVWVFLWMASSVFLQSGRGNDVLGLKLVTDSMQADIARQFPGARAAEFGVGLVERESPLVPFAWSGADFWGAFAAQRLVVLGVALGLALLGSIWFHRFDPARGGPRRRFRGPVGAEPPAAETVTPKAVPHLEVRRPATPAVPGSSVLQLIRAETRNLLAGASWWWWGVAAGLSGIAAVVSTESVAPVALALCWVWPTLVWSRLGSQESEHEMTGTLAAYPGRRRRLLSSWAAGAVLASVVGAVALIRLLVAGDLAGVAAWVGGALFIPALALLLGTSSRSSRPFQVIYLLLWYLVFNGAAEVDYMGAVKDGPNPALVVAAGIAFVLAAVATAEARHARR
ncbi:hypothetical protein ACN27G_26490 [Plantactinospora sp. WMMB334]|uniref:hypothetical protein n=1 Tax=Plantactinospora sp. WMMB334 TaxID=3404119 RepID=UPI003B9233AB